MIRFIQKTKQLHKTLSLSRRFSTTQQAEEEHKQEDKAEDDIWDEEDNVEEEEDEKSQRRRKLLKNSLLFSIFGLLGANAYISKKAEFDRELAKESPFHIPYVYGVASTVTKTCFDGYNYLLYPPITKFLPDEPPLRPELLRKTLVLNFEGTLYSKDFSVGNGVLIHLRPGFKKFVDKMSQLYDIVIYSNEDTAFMTEVIQTIDPYQRYFMWNMGREFFTTKGDGQYKDLRFLNRDPKKFIVVDFTRDSYLNNKDNVVVIDKYIGQEEDVGLRNLSLFLEHCAVPGVKDIRKEIKKFGGEDSVVNYREKLQKKYENAKNRRNLFFGFGQKKQTN